MSNLEECPRCGGLLEPEVQRAWYRCTSCHRGISRQRLLELRALEEARTRLLGPEAGG